MLIKPTSGYDFGYFVKLLTGESLPTSEDLFFEKLRKWFPTIYDIKFMMRACKVLKGGLQDVADDLGVRRLPFDFIQFNILTALQVMRIGPSHQAGSDSLLTASTFFKMRELYFNDAIDDNEYNGKLYGLGQTFTVPNGITESVRGSAATIAEREDRGPARDQQSQASNSQVQMMGMAALTTPAMAGAMPAPMPTSPYGPLGANGPYMRTAMVGGGR